MMRLLLSLIISFIVIVSSSSSTPSSSSVLVVGSINADIIVPIDRFPKPGETIVCPQNHRYKDDAGKTIAGGKGANQAVSISRLSERSIFVCQFGNDANGLMLEKVLNDNNVDISFSKKCDRPSGLGLVMLERDGSGSAIVVGGANAEWPEKDIIAQNIRAIFTENKVSCVLLQMEVPQYVNEVVAEVAVEFGIDVFQDVGGEERDISSEHLKRCSYISPNLTELKRLTKMECNSEEQIIDAAKELQRRGSSNILVTLGSEGSLLLLKDGEVIRQPAMVIDRVVDETGCGDNFRSSFVVALFCNKKSVKDSLLFASAAGASAARKLGAIPSMATRSDINDILKNNNLDIRGGESVHDGDDDCPFLFASRLNSMKDRRDLCQEGEEEGVLGYIARQGRIKGLDLVDFNYPQHITSPVVTEELKQELLGALAKANKRCGAICTRFPKLFQAGAFTNPNEELRKRAIEITKEACEWSIALNANEVVVWSAFCGYDYPLQVDYNVMWDRMVAAFQEVCDAYPNVKVSLEYKPTDENVSTIIIIVVVIIIITIIIVTAIIIIVITIIT